MSAIAKTLSARYSRVRVALSVAALVVSLALVAVATAGATEPGPSELSEAQVTALTNGAKEGSKSLVATVFAILPYILLVGVAMFVVGWLVKKFGFKRQSA